jgi:hypothetical protein
LTPSAFDFDCDAGCEEIRRASVRVTGEEEHDSDFWLITRVEVEVDVETDFPVFAIGCTAGTGATCFTTVTELDPAGD